MARNYWAFVLLAVVGCSAPDDGGLFQSMRTPTGLQADLAAVSQVSEVAVAHGKVLDVRVTVKNQGAAASRPVAGRWDLKGAELLSQSVTVPALKPGETAKLFFHYRFGPAQSGQFFLVFTADPDGKLAERDTGNNRITISVVVAPLDARQPLADLAVEFDLPSVTIDVDAYIVAVVTITNQGAAAWPVEGLWELQGRGWQVSEPVDIPALDANESIQLVFHQPPDPSRRGRSRLTFTANPAGLLPEKDFTNNTAESEIVVLPLPDLKGEILSASPLAVASASAVDLQVRWSNHGLSPNLYPVTSSAPVEIHLVKTGERLDWSNYITSATVPVLAPGEITTVTYRVQAWRGAGSYSWQVTAEAAIYEDSVTDNTAKLDGATVTSPLQIVWVSSVPTPSIGSPATEAVNGDGTWDLLIGRLSDNLSDDDLYAIDGNNGLPLWSSGVPGEMLSTPAFLRDATDSTALIYSPDDGELTAFDAFSGNLLWQQPVGLTFITFSAADIDLDGRSDLILAQNDGLSALEVTDGSVRRQWPFPQTTNAFASSPALADFTHDGFPDLVLASMVGNVFAFANTGAAGLAFAWAATLDAGVIGGPAMADLDGDGETEVALGDLSGQLSVFSAATGAYVWSATTPVERIWTPPALIRKNGVSGFAVVLSGTSAQSGYFGSWSSTLLAYDGVAGTLLWRVDRPGTPGSAVAIDVDHDGNDELLWLIGDRVPAVWPLDMPAMTGAHGWLYLIGNDGTIQTVFEVPGAVWSPPLAGDLDLDGWLDIVLSSSGPDGTMMRLSTPWSWPAGSGWAGFPGSSVHPGFHSWP